MSAIYVVDIILLVILYLLIMFMCGYSVFCVYRIIRSMQMRILLRPTRVIFSHKKEGESTEELRTVVAYQNPFTGDYCVRKSGSAHGFENALASPDSGVSGEYEPLRPAPLVHPPHPPHTPHQPRPPRPPRPQLHSFNDELQRLQDMQLESEISKTREPMTTTLGDNTLNKTWNWNYKEYQI